ncbi:MAG: preprotein translocase subunit SecA [bacterium]
MPILSKLMGDPNQRAINKLMPLVEKINQLEKSLADLVDDDFPKKTTELKERLAKGESLDDLLPKAFALVREAAKRTIKQRHFDVQLIAGMALHQGQIAEMRTGEGKTLAATLPLYLNALAGQGCHLVTVNDYLSRRDCGWMGPIYHLLGLSVGVIIHEQAFVFDPDYTDEKTTDERLIHLKPVSRQEAYQTDITYGTNNEFGFDYLRDNMVQSLEQMVQRPLHYAIVDEVDSILIDEARTPLIISAPAEESTKKYYQFAQLVTKLKENEDYNIDEKMRTAVLSEAGIAKMEKFLGVDNIYTDRGVSEVHHIEQALRAHALYKLDRDYVVNPSADGGEVIIVDEFTGRLMQGRRYSEGLHQAIEAKENVQIQRESLTLATVTFQNYFRLYNKLAGMTGTAATEAEEFSKIYELEVLVIPTHRDMIRRDLTDSIYKNTKGKFEAVVKKIKELHENGQPVLVGTISIEKNEMLGEMLEREGVPCQILNAKQHEKEAAIIAQAGRVGGVTIATNMAGRGVDIVLGGDPFNEAEYEKVKTAGGLYIIGTERHEARRIDNQLRGRAGRQGDPGVSQFYLSTEDDLMRIFGSDRMKNIMERLKVPDDMPIENRLVARSIESAQKKVEGHNFDIRKHLVEYDDVINKHRETIYRKRKDILAMVDHQAAKAVVMQLVNEEIEFVVSFHCPGEVRDNWNTKEVYETMRTIFPLELSEEEKLKKLETREEIIKHLSVMAESQYEDLVNKTEEAVKKMNQEQEIKEPFFQIEKGLLLRAIDNLWLEHLEAMDHLRTGIGLRGYGQRDPLIEYKKESYNLFNNLLAVIRQQVVYSVFKIGIATKLAPSALEQQKNLRIMAPAKIMADGGSAIEKMAQQDAAQRQSAGDMVKPKLKNASGQKVGRNDPCPCNSGLKYKKCCGK